MSIPRGTKLCSGKVVCVDRKIYALTVGETYECIGEWYNSHSKRDCWVLKNNGGLVGPFEKACFISMNQYREIKLKELLNENN
jgi:hypothetical protein